MPSPSRRRSTSTSWSCARPPRPIERRHHGTLPHRPGGPGGPCRPGRRRPNPDHLRAGHHHDTH
ncbi:hypothetical protein BWR60_12345 [Inquilinus limosus]|uniref:Uncharacterized protein n=1 Tax=Inquilinus limosus TaxID=171674 RepID=A0A211ZP59_9PROT|nr:hypothetical protein BWR60_12345 [Inquilinus limosus]